jgi:prepilin-type N-terminal cleavage/methylation domain-containing protein
MKRRRRGFSLMEVILSIAILAAATVLLGELTRFGMRNAAAARDLTQAQLLCDSKLNEIVAGLVPADGVSGANFDETYDPDKEWTYSIASSVLDDVTGLTAVTVTVSQTLEPRMKPVQFSLTRWMIPIAAPTEETETTTESSTSSSTGGGSSGSQGAGQ